MQKYQTFFMTKKPKTTKKILNQRNTNFRSCTSKSEDNNGDTWKQRIICILLQIQIYFS